MAFGGFGDRGSSAPMSEINMVPLIDVMLVLLVIFIITAPLLTNAVKIDLPKASSTPNLTRPEHVSISIDASGTVFWNGERVDRAGLRQKLAAESRKRPQSELHLRADKTTHYQRLAEVMADAATAGMSRLGFVTEPESAPPQ